MKISTFPLSTIMMLAASAGIAVADKLIAQPLSMELLLPDDSVGDMSHHEQLFVESCAKEAHNKYFGNDAGGKQSYDIDVMEVVETESLVSEDIDGDDEDIDENGDHYDEDIDIDMNEDVDENEYLENLFDALSASLLSEQNVDAFLGGQGVELMLRCLSERVNSGFGALKVLFFCMAGTGLSSSSLRSYKAASQTFVEAGGLKLLFPIFMGRKSSMPKPAKCTDAGNIKLLKKYAACMEEGKKPSKRAKRVAHANRDWFSKIEMHCIQILYSLTQHIDEESAQDSKARLLAKFIESDCEKCDRSVELCLKYDSKMRQAEYAYFKSDEAEDAEERGINVDLAALNAKLIGGGDLFHRISAILAFAAIGSKRCHEHILEQLRVNNSGIGLIKDSLREFANMLNEDSQKKQLNNYLSAI